jgi:hypothetical protein
VLKRRGNGKGLEWGRLNEQAGKVRDTEGSDGEVKWSRGKQKTGEEEKGGRRLWKEQSTAGSATLESLQDRIILSCSNSQPISFNLMFSVFQ